jgi:hypothetical protein
MVARALEVIKPDAVLIEGPPDAASVLHHAASGSMVPPGNNILSQPSLLQNGLFAQPGRYAQKFILGILSICLR